MLHVRPEQLHAFELALEAAYISRLLDFLDAEFAASVLPPPHERHTWVTTQVKKARGYWLLSEQEISIYVVVATMQGPDFDLRFPEVSEVLHDDALPAAEKADWLADWCDEQFEAKDEPDEA